MILSAGAASDLVPLDGLVRRWAAERPDAPALFDAPDRPLWSDGAPRRLTWAQTDAAVSGIAGRLAELGLAADAVVALLGPNASDLVLAVLACQRAQLTPVVMPATWRNREVGMAVDAVGARAIVTVTRAGPHLPADRLRYVAAERFGIRAVCAFGAEVPDGVVALEDCLTDATPSLPPLPRSDAPADHVALVTWDCRPDGFVPVPRSHAELLALGTMWQAAEELAGDGTLLSTLSPASVAAWGLALVPWLVTGATLVLHQGFDATVLGVQIERHGVTHVVLPQVAADAALRESLLPDGVRLVRLIRRPDLDTRPPSGTEPLDALAFGEVALAEPVRRHDGRAALPLGDGSVTSPGTRLGTDGTVQVCGLGVPASVLPTRSALPAMPAPDEGWVSTCVPARAEDGVAVATAPRPEILNTGGSAYSLATIEGIYATVPGAVSVGVAAVPCPILGQRLVLDAMPEPDAELAVTSLILHAEALDVSPLVMTADAEIGDRRRANRLVGAA